MLHNVCSTFAEARRTCDDVMTMPMTRPLHPDIRGTTSAPRFKKPDRSWMTLREDTGPPSLVSPRTGALFTLLFPLHCSSLQWFPFTASPSLVSLTGPTHSSVTYIRWTSSHVFWSPAHVGRHLLPAFWIATHVYTYTKHCSLMRLNPFTTRVIFTWLPRRTARIFPQGAKVLQLFALFVR